MVPSIGPSSSFTDDLQITSQELRDAIPEAPILLRVSADGDDKIMALYSALGLELLRERRVEGLFCLCVPALLENLDENEVVGPLKPEVGILADELVGIVLCDDLAKEVVVSAYSEKLCSL